MKKYNLFLMHVGLSLYASAQSFEAPVKQAVDSFYLAHPNSVGIWNHVESKHRNKNYSYAVDNSDKNLKTSQQADQPALMASNTKFNPFFNLLFEGKQVVDINLIAKVITPIYSKANYCLAMKSLTINSYTTYYHSAWWGTDAMYFPQLNTAFTIYILERTEKPISADICKKAFTIITTQ